MCVLYSAITNTFTVTGQVLNGEASCRTSVVVDTESAGHETMATRRQLDAGTVSCADNWGHVLQMQRGQSATSVTGCHADDSGSARGLGQWPHWHESLLPEACLAKI